MRTLSALRVRALLGSALLAAVVVSCQPPPARVAEQQGPVSEAPTPEHSQSGGALQIGDRAPDFSLPGSDGRTYRLADYRGRQPVVLAWFAKAFTGG